MYKNYFSRILAVAVVAAFCLLNPQGCARPHDSSDDCSDNCDDSGNAPKPQILSDSNDATGLFGYNGYETSYFFTQQVKNGGLGPELSNGFWGNAYPTMARFDVGGQQYIFGQAKSGYWFIQNILPSGDLGPETDNGTWGNYYFKVIGFHVEARTFIWGQNSDTNYWFIQEILPGGKMGAESNNGTWGHFYNNLVPFEISGRTFIYGQTDSHTLGSGYRWFIQEITAGGYMGPETASGYWQEYYQVGLNLLCGTNYYIFGLADNSHHWFIQNIVPGGWMGYESDSGNWGNFYATMTSFQEGGMTYIFGQNNESKYWFIQNINSNGTMGAETSSGTWNNYYWFVFPFTFSSQYLDVHNWMTKNWSILNNKTLHQISMPGSHDAGMSSGHDCDYASTCNTKTQTGSIYDQLQTGTRYFDIRPVLDWSGDVFWCGHFGIAAGSAMGCEGESLSDALLDVISFVNQNPNEIIILKLSHCFVLDHIVNKASDNCDPSGNTEKYVTQVRNDLSHILYKCASSSCLKTATLTDIRKAGANVVVLVGENDNYSDSANGIFDFYADAGVHDDYSNSNNLSTMINDQLNQLMTQSYHDANLMYLLSWTLTMDTVDAENCGSGATDSILEMAEKANTTLTPTIWGSVLRGNITPAKLPNIIYVDKNDTFSAKLAIMLNNHFYSTTTAVPEGEFMMGCNSTNDANCSSDEYPYHSVSLPNFEIDTHLTTSIEYRECVDRGVCSPPGTGGGCTYDVNGKETYPINCVDWYQAQTYCEWRGKRLPTEAEWEKSARGTDGRTYPWGEDDPICEHAVMSANGCSNAGIQPIAIKPAGSSPYGLTDMAGNVSEWVSDWYKAGYYADSTDENPQGPKHGSLKSVRGGSFESDSASDLRVSERQALDPEGAYITVGLRCAGGQN